MCQPALLDGHAGGGGAAHRQLGLDLGHLVERIGVARALRQGTGRQQSQREAAGQGRAVERMVPGRVAAPEEARQTWKWAGCETARAAVRGLGLDVRLVLCGHGAYNEHEANLAASRRGPTRWTPRRGRFLRHRARRWRPVLPSRHERVGDGLLLENPLADGRPGQIIELGLPVGGSQNDNAGLGTDAEETAGPCSGRGRVRDRRRADGLRVTPSRSPSTSWAAGCRSTDAAFLSLFARATIKS